MRAAWVVARLLGAACAFAAALVAGVLLHLDLPAARRVVAARASALLAAPLEGKIVVERVGALSLRGASGVDARAEDPCGVTVVRARGMSARIAIAPLIRSIAGGGAVVVTLPEASIDDAEVDLDADPAGRSRIADAFTPRPPRGEGRGRGVRLSIGRVLVGHVSVRGQPRGAPRIDADVAGAEGGVFVAPPEVTIDVARARARVRSPALGGQEARGGVEARLVAPSPAGGAFALRGAFAGTIGSIGASVRAAYDGDAVDASADVPSAAPAQVRALIPAWPLREAVAVHAEARGVLPRLDVRAHAEAGGGAVDASGPITLSPLSARLRVDARSIDPRGIAAAAPQGEVTASGTASIDSGGDGSLKARVALDVAAGRLGAAWTPPATLTGEIARGPGPQAVLSAAATLAIHEPGAPAVVTARLVPSAGGLVVAYAGEARAARLEDVPILRGAARGSAAARVAGTLDLRSGRVDAAATAAAEGLSSGPLSIGALRAAARVSGPIVAPEADVDLSAEGLAAPALRLSAVRARARFELARGTLRDVDVRVDEGGETMTARADAVRVAPAEIRVDDGVVEGFGAPLRAALHGSAANLAVYAVAPSIDLARVARFAHWPAVRAGRASLEVEANVGRGVAEGHAAVRLDGGEIAAFHGVEGRVDATLHGHRLTGFATARVGDVASLDVTSSGLRLGGRRVLDLASWRRAWGAIDVAAHVDLAKLASALPPGAVPLDRIGGVLDLKARVERDSASDVTPAVDAWASTTGLALSGRSGVRPWRVEGVDPAVHATVDGATGATALSVRLRDAAGDLATLGASSSAVPYSVILLGGALAPALEATPFDARVDVSARRLEAVPGWLGLAGSTGALEGHATWSGAALRPAIEVEARLSHGVIAPRVFALPADAELTARYDGAHAGAALRASVRGRAVLDAEADADVRAADLFSGGAGARLPWTASARAALHDFPLQALSALGDRQVRGRATGAVRVDGLRRNARAEAALTFDGLEVGGVACRSAGLRATLDGRAMEASASVDHGDGSLSLRASAATRWGSALAPGLDASRPAALSVSARSLRATLLAPLVSRVFGEIDGRVDGDASVTIDPAAGKASPRGALALSDGVLELTSLGGELTDVSGTLKLSPDGVLRLEDVRGRSLNGRLMAAATARLDGLSFGGARATLQVPRASPLPVVFEGVQVGTMDGTIDASIAAPRGAPIDVALGASSLHLVLPSAAAHDVQALGDLEDVQTGFARDAQGFVPAPLDPAPEEGAAAASRPIRIAVDLGKDVQVKRAAGGEGQPELSVSLEGAPVLTIDGRVRASGQIQLVRGTIGVGGKPFEIEKGTVTFVGDDPANPQVVLAAGWTAPDGTRVTANFVGPLKAGKVTLHADPPPPGGDSGILALILFGSAEQSAGAGAAPAAGFAGGAATAPVNRWLGGVNGALEKLGLGGGLSTKVDTSQVSPRPEVELQIARDVSLEVAWVPMPPPGMPDTTLATFNWRFLRRWSLLTTVGNTGTSILDVVWQHRY